MAQTKEVVGTCLGFEVLGVASALTSAQGLGSIPVDAASNRVRCLAHIQCAKSVDTGTKGNVAVRYRLDGTAPTVDVGQELQPGQTLELDCSLAAFSAIGVAANAKLNVTYYSWGNMTHVMN